MNDSKWCVVSVRKVCLPNFKENLSLLAKVCWLLATVQVIVLLETTKNQEAESKEYLPLTSFYII